MTKSLLFLSGTPRSGTSALVRLLNMHPSVMIGMERYFSHFNRGNVDSGLFAMDRFLDVREGDTHPDGGFGTQDVAQLRQRYDPAQIIGDKFPLLYLHFDQILPKFPNARHVFIIRNPLSVAESYQQRFENRDDTFNKDYRAAVDDWNKGLAAILTLPEAARARFCVVEYESIFKNNAEIERLFAFLNLSPPKEEALIGLRKQSNELEQSLVPRRDDIRSYVAKNAKWDMYSRLTHQAAAQERSEVT